MSWINRDIASLIRDYSDHMTYGRLLCTSKLFGYNENLTLKFLKLIKAYKDLRYQKNPIRPYTAFETFNRKKRFNLPNGICKEWKELSKEDRSKLHIKSSVKHQKYESAKNNLKTDDFKDKLIRRLVSIEDAIVKCFRNITKYDGQCSQEQIPHRVASYTYDYSLILNELRKVYPDQLCHKIAFDVYYLIKCERKK